MTKRYQDFVIAKGKLIGDFKGLYENFDDPWNQSSDDHKWDSRRIIATNYCKRLRKKYNSNKVVELGCGFGYITENLRLNNFESIGTDISRVAIEKAKKLHPESNYIEMKFNDYEKLFNLNPDILIMAEITWYVLDDLNSFLKEIKNFAKNKETPTFLIHLLATYEPGVQKYGADKFTNLGEILKYFNLDYLEYGFVKTKTEFDENSQGTYFVAKI